VVVSRGCHRSPSCGCRRPVAGVSSRHREAPGESPAAGVSPGTSSRFVGTVCSYGHESSPGDLWPARWHAGGGCSCCSSLAFRHAADDMADGCGRGDGLRRSHWRCGAGLASDAVGMGCLPSRLAGATHGWAAATGVSGNCAPGLVPRGLGCGWNPVVVSGNRSLAGRGTLAGAAAGGRSS
jgi:hypothetical protein